MDIRDIALLLRKINTGEIKIELLNINTANSTVDDNFYPIFQTPDGTKICIFNDCCEWDYIEYIEKDGMKLYYDYIYKSDDSEEIRLAHPNTTQAHKYWHGDKVCW